MLSKFYFEPATKDGFASSSPESFGFKQNDVISGLGVKGYEDPIVGRLPRVSKPTPSPRSLQSEALPKESSRARMGCDALLEGRNPWTELHGRAPEITSIVPIFVRQ